MRTIAVIPPKSNRIIQREYDKELYKERNFVSPDISYFHACFIFAQSFSIGLRWGEYGGRMGAISLLFK
jgi:hypothetical protein